MLGMSTLYAYLVMRSHSVSEPLQVCPAMGCATKGSKSNQSIKHTAYAETVKPLWRDCGPDYPRVWRRHWWHSQSFAVWYGSDLEDTAKTVFS